MSLPDLLGSLRRIRHAPRTQILTVSFTGGLSLRLRASAPLVQEFIARCRDPRAAEAWFMERLAPAELREGVRAAPVPCPPEHRHALDAALAALASHLPDGSLAFVEGIVRDEIPCLIRVVRKRRTKHGDHRPARSGGLSEITVNDSGQPWQFLITLLHEIAHAEVDIRFGREVAAHGVGWRLAYQRLLRRALEASLFPDSIRSAVRRHADRPPSSSSLDHQLQIALHEFSGDPGRRTVSSLPPGTWFRVDGGLLLRRGRFMRTRIECTTADGRRFRVLPSLTVIPEEELPGSSGGME